MKNIVVIVGGPSGCGKTTTGLCIAAKLHCAFEEGDSYHSEANVAKMRRGEPLNDDDRWPWLQSLRKNVIEKYTNEGRSVVLACSALQKKYRDVLRGTSNSQSDSGPLLFFVTLAVPYETLVHRVQQRKGHYMPASLVQSQIALMEPLDPTAENGVQLDNEGKTAEQTAEVVLGLLRSKL